MSTFQFKSYKNGQLAETKRKRTTTALPSGEIVVEINITLPPLPGSESLGRANTWRKGPKVLAISSYELKSGHTTKIYDLNAVMGGCSGWSEKSLMRMYEGLLYLNDSGQLCFNRA